MKIFLNMRHDIIYKESNAARADLFPGWLKARCEELLLFLSLFHGNRLVVLAILFTQRMMITHVFLTATTPLQEQLVDGE